MCRIINQLTKNKHFIRFRPPCPDENEIYIRATAPHPFKNIEAFCIMHPFCAVCSVEAECDAVQI